MRHAQGSSVNSVLIDAALLFAVCVLHEKCVTIPRCHQNKSKFNTLYCWKIKSSKLEGADGRSASEFPTEFSPKRSIEPVFSIL